MAGLAIKAVYENELAHGPADRIDGPFFHEVFVIQQGQMGIEAPHVVAESGPGQRVMEIFLKIHQFNKLPGAAEDACPI